MEETSNLAFGTSRVMFLGFCPLRTVKRLMSYQIVHGGELDAARGTDKLNQRRRRRARWRRTAANRGLSRLTIMLLMGDEVFVPTEDYVAFFASKYSKFIYTKVHRKRRYS